MFSALNFSKVRTNFQFIIHWWTFTDERARLPLNLFPWIAFVIYSFHASNEDLSGTVKVSGQSFREWISTKRVRCLIFCNSDRLCFTGSHKSKSKWNDFIYFSWMVVLRLTKQESLRLLNVDWTGCNIWTVRNVVVFVVV